MKLYEILIPTITPAGKPVRTRFHKVWDAKVREIAKGLTILTPTRGQWVAPDGELFLERMIPVRISCTEEQIHAIADMSAVYYKQLAMFFYEISSNVFLKHYDPERNYRLKNE